MSVKFETNWKQMIYTWTLQNVIATGIYVFGRNYKIILMVSYPLLVLGIRISASKLSSNIIWYPKAPESPGHFGNVLNVLGV